MLDNMFPREELASLARANSRPYHSQSLNNKLVSDAVEAGWSLLKNGKTTSRLTKAKAHATFFEDRVWMLLYRMGLPLLSGEGGGELLLQEGAETRVKNQLDVVAIDDELAIAIECKTSEKFSRRPQFQEELAKLGGFRDRFIRAVMGIPEHRDRSFRSIVTADSG